jgi:hypothetical protein
MSARSALLAYLRQAGLSTPRAEANLDAYAHELAEKIRAAGCQEVNWCGCPMAADLIDPEKEKS